MFQSSVRSSLVVLAVLVGAPGVAAAAEPIRTLPAELADWPVGPVRWLLMPDELRAFRALETREAAMAFIRSFWQRRDPTPEDAVNPFADAFSERVTMADELFSEELIRGALTDRGGALLLLGSPGAVQILRRRISVGKLGRATRAADGTLHTQEVEIERWRYPREAVVLALPGRDLPETIELEFVRRPRAVVWSSGKDWAERASRAALREPLP
jgi:GWxTD domain-containing protein